MLYHCTLMEKKTIKKRKASKIAINGNVGAIRGLAGSKLGIKITNTQISTRKQAVGRSIGNKQSIVETERM